MKKSKNGIVKVGPESPLLDEVCEYFVIDNDVFSCLNSTVRDIINTGYNAGVTENGIVWEKE